MQVITYKAYNVLGVKDIQFDLAGRHLFLVGGKNAQGKSSALAALLMALAGKSGMDDYPALTLRKGEKKGKVAVELTGEGNESITVELSLRQDKTGAVVEDFRVLDSAGKKEAEPRKLLQKLFTLRAFDPLAFERMKPKEQATLVQQMLGLDLSKFDREHAKVYEQRTGLGRDGKNLAARLEAAPKHEDAPAEEVKIVDLLAQIDEAKECNAKRAAIVAEAREAMERSGHWGKEVERLSEELKKAQVSLQNCQSVLKECESELKDTAKYPDRTSDIDKLKVQIAKADETNRKVRENAAREKLEAEVKAFRGEYQRLSDKLKEIQEER